MNIGDGRRFFAGTQGVLAVIDDFKTWNTGKVANAVDQRGQRSVTVAIDPGLNLVVE